MSYVRPQRLRILLIKPRWPVGFGQSRYGKYVRFPSLALGILAALSRDHDVSVVDADQQKVPTDSPFDLVGITATSFCIDQAIALAKIFRARGAKVILGGVHASIKPDECQAHADAVAVGEGEVVWPQVLRDMERGELQDRYVAQRPTEMADVPAPRHDLLAESRWFTVVEATRGCNNQCKFCYLPATPWGAWRSRPVEQVVAELKALRQEIVLFADDNLLVNREYALELCRALKPLKKAWVVQAPTSIGRDLELLDALADAGCINLQFGFQSFNPQTLAEADVGHNRVGRYRELVEQCHARGIIITGLFVFGFDNDKLADFDATARAIRELDIDDVGVFVLTPMPGTRVRDDLKEEGRLLPMGGSAQYGWSRAIFEPKNMTPAELEAGVQRVYNSLQSHFNRRLFWVLRKHWRLLLRNPQLLWTVAAGNLRKGEVGQEL